MDSTDSCAGREHCAYTSEQNTIHQAFHPLCTILKIYGLYSDMVSRYSRKTNKIATVRNVAHSVYCTVVGVWLLLILIKHSYELYLNSDSGISSNLASSLANVFTMSMYFVFVPISLWRLSFLGKLMDEMQRFLNRTSADINVLFCRNTLCVVLGCVTVSSLIYIPVVIYKTRIDDAINATSTLSTSYASFRVFGAQNVHVAISYTWITLVTFFSVGIPCSVFILFACVGYFVWKGITHLLVNMKQDASRGMTDAALRKYRTHFEILVEIVEQLDSCVSYHFGTVYLLGLIVPCLMLYGIVHDSLSRADIQFSIAHILFPGTNIGIYMLAAVILHGKMHQPLGVLYKMNIEYLSEKGMQELSLFISQLSGSSIGISVYGLFVIDTSTVLMLIGTLVTYAVVVVQLQPISAA